MRTTKVVQLSSRCVAVCMAQQGACDDYLCGNIYISNCENTNIQRLPLSPPAHPRKRSTCTSLAVQLSLRLYVIVGTTHGVLVLCSAPSLLSSTVH